MEVVSEGRRRPLGGQAGIGPGLVALLLYSLLPLGLLTLPLLLLIGHALDSGTLWSHLTDPAVTRAMGLSLVTSICALGLSVAFGLPIAYLLARRRFPGRTLLDTLVDVPLVLPPAVAGLALLLAFGRRGLIGSVLAGWGIDVAFTPVAVVLAQTFVASPFFIRSARTGFGGVDPMLEKVSGTLGQSDWGTFWQVTFPLSAPSLVAGAVMTWARALGEFGATIMFAGNLEGRSRTMPLAIFTALESDLGAAVTLSVILVAASFGVLWIFRRVAAHVNA